MNRSRSLPPVPKRDFLYGKDYVRERESKTPTPQISRSTTPIPEPIYRSPTPARKWAEEQIEPTSIEYAEIDYEDTNQDQENDKYFQKQEKKKFSLDQKKVLKVALNLYGEDLIYDCLTKNVKIELRQTVLEEFKYKFEKNAEKGSKRKLVKGTHQVLVFLLKDKIASVFQTACDITCKLYQDVIDNSIDQSLLTSTTRELFSILMLRASENVPRVAEAALNTIHCIIKCEEVEHLSVLDDLLTEDIQQKSLAVVTSIRVDLVTFLITFYGISDDPKDSMSIRNLSKLSLGALEHTSSIVREAGQELVLLLYRKDPRIVRQTLEKVPGNRNIKKIIEIFDQIDSNKT
ncbi:centrosomal protein of 104 kDa [Eurytemora carolleeae]|uniref:centrosomal protein of 104 kDa n=1 Tax=Eurytemora carolleeae TaxID=1294199 RepID=UPI000C75831A|nr:centrosomal protein of 104 kDa [Eurytemora carolleeae]|eukprot:XP_023330117.1 centrosomal protein of 104 kDa-like [Eurytemora affinis]